MQQPATAIRSYRLYFRDAKDALARPHDVDLASDEAARELAVQMLEKQTSYRSVEVWDRARLVSTVRKEA